MPRGGAREGQVGKAYANRTDLAMSGGTSGHQVQGGSMRGSGTSNTELASATTSGPPAPPSAMPAEMAAAPEALLPLDAPGGGSGPLLDLRGRARVFPNDRDTILRALYQMYGHEDVRELLERRTR